MSPASNELPGFFICHTIYIFAEKDKATMSKYLSILFLCCLPTWLWAGENYRFRVYLKDKGDDGFRVEEWIHQRLLAIRIRNELTDEWKKRGVQKGKEYAILTDEISRAWSGMTTGQYKRLKGLTKENLRDNMTDLELVLTMLAEASTTDISKTAKPQTFEENKQVAKRGGKVAGIARQALEAETGKPVITEKNAVNFQQLVTDVVEDAAELPENPTEKKDKD